jgi:hypothetical protein
VIMSSGVRSGSGGATSDIRVEAKVNATMMPPLP